MAYDQTRRTCRTCGCHLAADNPGPYCAPCGVAVGRAPAESVPPAPTTAIGIRELTEIWSRGFDAFRDAAGLDPGPAAELAVALGLVPHRWQLTASQLAELASATGRRRTNSELARRWGVSRWTVSTWRREVGLERMPRATTRARLDPSPLVDGVQIRREPRTRLIGPRGPIRLGHSARALVDALVDAHPSIVTDAQLLPALFPDAESSTARAALHATVSRLRRHLPPGTIVREPDGYRLAVAADAIHEPAPKN